MINLSIPFWLLGTGIGIFCLCLLGVALSIGYRIRRLKFRSSDDPQISSMTTAMLNNHFQHNLLAMQVDAVFDSLNALIETERLKLKAVIAPSLQHLPKADEPANDIEPALNEEQSVPDLSTPLMDRPVEQTAVPADTTDNSDLSRAERDLADKMRQYRNDGQYKLEAVA